MTGYFSRKETIRELNHYGLAFPEFQASLPPYRQGDSHYRAADILAFIEAHREVA